MKENHKLEALIYKDITIYQPCSLGEVHHRIGKEIPIKKVRKMIYKLCLSGDLQTRKIKIH